MCLFLSCATLASECLAARTCKAREVQHAQPRSLLSFQRAAYWATGSKRLVRQQPSTLCSRVNADAKAHEYN
ncbi:hypothetical protein GQ54DRAFT_300570 [Martensiomyces pterosporus]|nr:hypothetical protein GQ54DRAFT_300570 [Martensiomyces pterosporus]